VSIRPKDQSRMKGWIDSRKSEKTHSLTTEVRGAIDKSVKRPKE